MKKSVIGIIAHVDAGKTTLSEAILYEAGKIRSLGRVDSKNTTMDTHELEKARGITIFASEAVFNLGEFEVTLLDTPGHVDFSSETERILRILDYAILVISATDSVQSHTLTLWKLLEHYNIPTVVFVTKTDFCRYENAHLLNELKSELSENCIDFSQNKEVLFDELAVCSETALSEYLEFGEIKNDTIKTLLSNRLVFPCYFGSGLKNQGIDTFLDSLKDIITQKEYPQEFGAKVFKITHDNTGAELTHLKITGGKLKVRDSLEIGDKTQKISGIRIYSGIKFITAEEVSAGAVCVVTGLSGVENGQGLGFEKDSTEPVLQPVMNYSLILPEKEDPQKFLGKIKLLEKEDPMLKISWNSYLQQINVSLMGDIQVEILKSIISDRFNVDVKIENGHVVYKETIENTVEGVGHYEPLRHYAEVHLILSPLERGSGLVFESKCSEDSLSRNWQNLILMHLKEKEHLGVLTGSPITDMKITLAAGRAHLKHTEGGDFRQSTYRAVRQGLMTAKSILLEPYYSFKLEVPSEQTGRAISDIKMKHGEFSPPEEKNGICTIEGTAPVTTFSGYASEVASYTSGAGRLKLSVFGYKRCHNEEEVLQNSNYSPENDIENTPDSVFCAHGAGFNVKWNEVPQYMHIETCLQKEVTYTPILNKRNFHIDDKELEAIMEREFGKAKLTQTLYRPTVKNQEEEKETKIELNTPVKYVLVDGYNCIFQWETLKKIAASDISAARDKLSDILSNYSAFTKTEIVLVFDGYKVKGNRGESFNYHNIHVVYTKEHELGDVYIEKMISQIGKNHNVRVVSSDSLIQLSAVRNGVLRVSAVEFEKEIMSIENEIEEYIINLKNKQR